MPFISYSQHMYSLYLYIHMATSVLCIMLQNIQDIANYYASYICIILLQ